MAGSSEHGNKSFGFMRGVGLSYHLSTSVLQNDLLSGVN
jgi:hypothetical protein